MDSSEKYKMHGSQESLYGASRYNLYSPPVTKSKNNIFFNSDDSLYKAELRKLTIPKINIEYEPEFKFEVTDFSEPNPKSVAFNADNSFGQLNLLDIHTSINHSGHSTGRIVKSWKNKANESVQQNSFSLDMTDIPFIDVENDTDKFLNVGPYKLSRCKFTSSLQDLSSSNSSINSGIHESNLDLSQLDPDTPVRHWKSPDISRHGLVKELTRHFEGALIDKSNISVASSVPQLCRKRKSSIKSTSRSEENLDKNKLTEYERLEVIKLLRDWSINGSFAESTLNLKLRNTHQISDDVKSSNELSGADSSIKSDEFIKNSQNLQSANIRFLSEPDLSPKSKKFVEQKLVNIASDNSTMKYHSDNNIGTITINDSDFLHRCKFKNCIFNTEFNSNIGANRSADNTNSKDTNSNFPSKIKGILKLNNNFAPNIVTYPHFRDLEKNRRHSEIILRKPFNSQLIRHGSLEKLTKQRNKVNVIEPKKFPESYIVKKRSTGNNDTNQLIDETSRDNSCKMPKVIVIHKKHMPKTWKSCSDIKVKQRTVKKCCRNARKSCPVLKKSSSLKGKTQSCAEFDQHSLDFAARLAAVKDCQVDYFDCKNCDHVAVAQTLR